MKAGIIFVMAILSSFWATGLARALEKPAGPAILTITGHVTRANSAAGAEFDRAMLEKLEGRHATMKTPWTKGTVEFSGPYLRAVLDAAGAVGSRLVVRAHNDYSAEVPMEDAEKLDTILAIRMNGVEMSVRDKGPSFLVYPFDEDAELYNEKYFSRSVWQIKEIEVVE